MAHPNQVHWQTISKQMYADFKQHTLTFKLRRRRIVGSNGEYHHEALISDNQLDHFYDWLTARDENVN